MVIPILCRSAYVARRDGVQVQIVCRSAGRQCPIAICLGSVVFPAVQGYYFQVFFVYGALFSVRYNGRVPILFCNFVPFRVVCYFYVGR